MSLSKTLCLLFCSTHEISQHGSKTVGWDIKHQLKQTILVLTTYIGLVKDIENFAIILVPLIMILSMGHTGQIKGILLGDYDFLTGGNKVVP